MQTGRQTLATIEGAIAKLHGDETRLDTALKTAAAQAERLAADRGEALRALARIKLDEIAAGRLVRNLDAAERRAVDILEDSRHRMAAASERREAAVGELEAAEAQRHKAGEAVELALGEVEAVRADAEARVQQTVDWQAANGRFDAADAIAAGAERKAAQSESELGAKKRPYDQDALFTYLWGRNFGTSRYAAGNLARMIDRKMAEFIGYSGARANYAMLIEIPQRLREHASERRTAADAEKAALAAIERQAMVAAGIDIKERALAEARHKLAAAETLLEDKRTQLKSAEEARTRLIGEGSAPGYGEAVSTIAAGDAQDDMRTLYEEARRTPTDSDEKLVRRIELIDQRAAAVSKEIGELRRTAHDLARRRDDIEEVRDRFRRAGYDHPNATFGNDNQIGQVIAQILEGVVRSGILWDILREGFRTRPSRSRPDFGAPGFPFPFPMPGGGNSGPAGGGWREPSTRGGWFPSDSGGSRGNSSRSDDFTTGGSF
jgi:hypothetical protein